MIEASTGARRGVAPMRAWVAAGALVLLAGCARAPYTNRRQLIMVSAQEEAALGAQAFKQVVSRSHLDRDPHVNELVGDVGRRLATVANRPDFQWTFVVISDREANAFCLPGGKVAVYTGILPTAQDQAGLAVVLGHEIAHAIARHGAERISQAQLAELGGQALAIGLGRRELVSNPRGLRSRRADRRPLALWSHTGVGGGPHRPSADGAGGLRSSGGDQLLGADGAQRWRGHAGVSLDAPESRHARRAATRLDA